MMSRSVGNGYLPCEGRMMSRAETENQARREGEYLCDDEIAVVERGIVEVDKNIMITKLGDVGFLGELKAVKAIFTSHIPLSRSGRWHCPLKGSSDWISRFPSACPA